MTLKSIADTHSKVHQTVDAPSAYGQKHRSRHDRYRAIVNSATVNLIAKTLNKPLTKLFCHIHAPAGGDHQKMVCHGDCLPG